ncbi:MAG: response regulator [Gammaproteobacteria bacterium]|nr:response regulator [Gammaproteobacteria bacterium]
MPKKILIIEDEIKINQLLVDYFQASQFETHSLYDGLSVIEWVKENTPDLILLDLMLPGKDGIDLCKEIRLFSNVPIIMITARRDDIDRILGLEIGADDYICKPFNPREVVTRVKVIFRRMSLIESQALESQNLKKSDLENIEELTSIKLDNEKYLASFNEHRLDLTPVEFRLLQTLYSIPGKVFSRDQLMNNLYQDNRIVTDRTVDSHIKNLRKKFQQVGCSDEIIYSVYGVGYKLEF